MSYRPPYSLRARTMRRGGPLTIPTPPWGPLDGVPRLIVFVHGYNVDQDGAEDAWQITHELLRRSVPARNLKDLLLYYWPGDRRLKVVSKLNYFRTVEDAVEAGQGLADYLATLRPASSPLRVQFVGHSLGCRLVLSAIEKLKPVATVEIDRVVLMAAAVPEGLCGPGMIYGPDGVTWPETVIFSSEDRTLLRFFRLGQWGARHLAGIPDLDPGVERDAVGISGGPPGRWPGETKSCGLDHGDYWVKPENVEKLVPLFTRPAARHPKIRRTPIRTIPESRIAERRLRRHPALL
jgi:pimeloyl-ACP methyl ester carboxylesterase